MAERNLFAISIKHTEYRWKFGMPCVLWGHRTKDDEERSFGGYTTNPANAELYTREEFAAEYSCGCMKTDEPVKMEVRFCQKWKEYDTVLVDKDNYLMYCDLAGIPVGKEE